MAGSSQSSDPQNGFSTNSNLNQELTNSMANESKSILNDFSKIWNFLPGRLSMNNKETVEPTCNCEGACGCANGPRRGRTESVNLPFTAATWSPATTKFKSDLPLPQSQGKIQNLFFPTSKTQKRFKIRGSTSADNLYYLN
jgi:hypothetical protein